MISELSRNVHLYRINKNVRNYEQKVALLSDLHWDNPKCKRKTLERHLKRCRKENARILLNGDTFCLMQGKYDPRKAKQSIRPEHNVANYIDAVVDTAVDYFLPYADLIDVVGYGNHETNILRRLETDVVQRFVDGLNWKLREQGSDHRVYSGGYGGWLLIGFKDYYTYKIKYFHGSGGGGVVTRGEINLTRAMTMIDGADCFTMGHVHENKETFIVKETLNNNYDIINKQTLLNITGTYKEEYDEGYMGWHVERGAPPKPVGGRMLTIKFHRATKSKNNRITAYSTLLD